MRTDVKTCLVVCLAEQRLTNFFIRNDLVYGETTQMCVLHLLIFKCVSITARLPHPSGHEGGGRCIF